MNNFDQRLNVDVADLNVRAVIGQQLFVDPADIPNISKIPNLLTGSQYNPRLAMQTPGDD